LRILSDSNFALSNSTCTATPGLGVKLMYVSWMSMGPFVVGLYTFSPVDP
jgi:hypothetical protein